MMVHTKTSFYKLSMCVVQICFGFNHFSDNLGNQFGADILQHVGETLPNICIIYAGHVFENKNKQISFDS